MLSNWDSDRQEMEEKKVLQRSAAKRCHLVTVRQRGEPDSTSSLWKTAGSLSTSTSRSPFSFCVTTRPYTVGVLDIGLGLHTSLGGLDSSLRYFYSVLPGYQSWTGQISDQWTLNQHCNDTIITRRENNRVANLDLGSDWWYPEWHTVPLIPSSFIFQFHEARLFKDALIKRDVAVWFRRYFFCIICFKRNWLLFLFDIPSLGFITTSTLTNSMSLPLCH